MPRWQPSLAQAARVARISGSQLHAAAPGLLSLDHSTPLMKFSSLLPPSPFLMLILSPLCLLFAASTLTQNHTQPHSNRRCRCKQVKNNKNTSLQRTSQNSRDKEVKGGALGSGCIKRGIMKEAWARTAIGRTQGVEYACCKMACNVSSKSAADQWETHREN